jgi:hypothetical protein
MATGTFVFYPNWHERTRTRTVLRKQNKNKKLKKIERKGSKNREARKVK